AATGLPAGGVDTGSQAGHTLCTGQPARFDPRGPEAGWFFGRQVSAGVTVVIRATDHPRGFYGILSAHTREPRSFTDDDVHFLQSVANVLAAAIERSRMEHQIRLAEEGAQKERARAAQIREALRDRDEFISVAAHELRTPLTALQLRLQSLERGLRAAGLEKNAAAKLDDRIGGALRQTERLTHLIERLLDVSRVAAGRLELSPERFDLAQLVRQVAEDFREPAAAAGSELRFAGAERLEGSWDRLRMEQVLVNLFSNAVKYGAGRPISVGIDSNGERIRIRVADQGIGIAPDDLGRIFHRFERAAPVRNYGGLGLGLYISQHIVEAHGGRIEVSSTPGEGSTFVIDLPRAGVHPAPPSKEPRQARA